MSAPLIAVDIGNTTVKLGLFHRSDAREVPNFGQLIEFRTSAFRAGELGKRLPGEPHVWRVASVHRPSEQKLAAWVRSSRPEDDYHLLTYQDLPIEVRIDAPDRVGMDRLAAAVAANHLRRKGAPAIVVDAGTAITVDAVDADGAFLGGTILPGFRMTAKALATDTDLLPFADATFQGMPPDVIGNSTVAAIRSGIFWGATGAIRELVTRIGESLGGQPQVFVTGGDAEMLTHFMPGEAVFVPELVLAGIAWAAV